MARDITEKQHDEAVRVLRAEYYSRVRDMVEEAKDEIKAGNIHSREELDEYVEQSIDGSYWVIYTHANRQVIFVTDNPDAYIDDFGEPPIEGGDIDWAALAYAAMRRDVYDLLDAYSDEIDELLNPEEEDLDEARRPPRAPAPHRRRAPQRRAKAPRKKAPRKAPRRRR